jgi:hypothetical protein
MKKLLVVLLMVFSSSSLASELTLFETSFDNGFDGWNNIGLDWSIVSPGKGDYGQAAQVKYYAKGSQSYWLEKDLSRDSISTIIVEFDFKVDFRDGHLPYGGCKFLKLFGIPNSIDGYANVTFGMNYYDRNELKEVSYGGGTSLISRDSQSTIRYNGTQVNTYEPKPVINFYTYAIDDHLDQNWHKFKSYMRYNDNDLANGEYIVWIDENVRLHATNIVNRHNNNSPYIWKTHFGGYNGSNSNSFEPWYLTIDNVRISTPAAVAPKPGPPEKKEKNPKSKAGN